MYRYLFRTVYTARNSVESCVFLAKCGKTAAPVIRVANGGGVRALSTNTAKLCEKKNGVASTNQGDKTNADKEVDPTETSTLVTQKAEDDVRVIKMDEQSEEPVVLKTDDGSIMQQQVNVKTKQAVAKPKQGKTGAAKSGKENLLDLLGAMKVEVTNKRKRKSAPMPKHAATVEASSQSETLNPELIAAASAAASTLPNSSKAESELLQQLRQHEAITETQKKGNIGNLGVLIADMKVGQKPNLQNTLPVHQIQFDDDGRGYIADRTAGQSTFRKKVLFSRKSLNIFSPSADEEGDESTVARPSLWDIDFAHQLSLSVNQTLSNRLEEMIQWTKEGKLWQYPINNETGLEEEASVSFAEHIFLEKHLEEGFPREGPVRHFMELVVAGLSRNPYLTVQQKKEHISWFRDYFHQKEEVLKEAEVYLS